MCSSGETPFCRRTSTTSSGQRECQHKSRIAAHIDLRHVCSGGKQGHHRSWRSVTAAKSGRGSRQVPLYLNRPPRPRTRFSKEGSVLPRPQRCRASRYIDRVAGAGAGRPLSEPHCDTRIVPQCGRPTLLQRASRAISDDPAPPFTSAKSSADQSCTLRAGQAAAPAGKQLGPTTATCHSSDGVNERSVRSYPRHSDRHALSKEPQPYPRLAARAASIRGVMP